MEQKGKTLILILSVGAFLLNAFLFLENVHEGDTFWAMIAIIGMAFAGISITIEGAK